MKHIITKLLGTAMLLFIVGTPLVWGQKDYKIVNKKVQFGMRKAENRNIVAIIIHSTYNNSGGEQYDIDLVIRQFSQYGVSSHYVIGRDGSIYSLVSEQNVAFHAGKSQLPNGKTNLNASTIGIELINSLTDTPTQEQIQSLTLLVGDIKKRYSIEYVLRHSDIAPGRKTDPWNLDWDGFTIMEEIKNK